MKKICMIVEDYPPGGGGGGIFTKELSKRLSKEYKITVISRGERNSKKIEKGINVIRFGGNRIEFFAKSINYLIGSPAQDIYHAHGVLSGLIAKKIKLFKKKPIILHLHGFRESEVTGSFRYLLQKEITKLKYDEIISVDKESAKKVRAIGVKNKITIIPGGVDTSKFKPSK